MKKQVFLITFFIIATFIFTYPLIMGIFDFIPGFHSTDEPYGALWNFWQSNVNKPMIAMPFGISSAPSGYPLWNVINKYLTHITSNVFTYNLQIIVSFILSALFAYYLVKKLSNSKSAAIFAALLYSFSPYHFARSWQHLGLAQIQWMPLYLLALFKLYERKKFKNALYCALAFALVMHFDFYYAYFMAITTLLFILYIALPKKREEKIKFIKYVILSGGIALILILPNLVNIFKFIQEINAQNYDHGVYGYVRPFEDLFMQSARPLSYFLPAAVHPMFGKFTEQWVGSSIYGTSFTEHTLYLGWTVLVLAFLAFRRWREEHNFYIGFFVLLAIAAWLFSQPPWWKIGSVKIFMPSFFMYKILPMFRAYCRFGIVVMLAVAVLAGFGLKFILERFKTQRARVAIASLFCGLVLFEFWNWPPYKVIDVSNVPAVYYWFKEQPGDFVIAEYPLDINGPNELYKFYQTKHGKRLINGTIPGTYANQVAKGITKLSDHNAAGALKWMGAKYVLVHKADYLNTGLVEDAQDLNKIPKNPGLKLIKSFPAQDCPRKDISCTAESGPVDVYEVVASAIEPKVK